MSFEGSVFVVTGAASGIGRGVVTAAAAQGAQVLALDIDDVAGAALAAETGARFLRCDVSQGDDWSKAAEVIGEMGALRYLHLNAGIQSAPPDAPLEEYRFANLQIDRYRRMMGVNVDGVVLGLHALLPLMSEGGAIVVTSSLAGVTPYAIDPLYAMSKHAVSGLVRSLATELGKQGIVINAICPGGIDTAIIPHAQRTAEAIFMTADHVAQEVLSLMGEEVTGKTWAKVAQDKPLFVIRAPGDRKPGEGRSRG